MSKKQSSAKPHRERTSANADSFFIVRGSKSTLLCKHKKPNLITGAEEHVDEIVVELSTEKEKL